MYRTFPPGRPTDSRVRVPSWRRRSAAALRGRVRLLCHDGESGAQVIEYAMLGAVAAVACGALVALLKGGLLTTLIQGVMDGVVQWAQSWFA